MKKTARFAILAFLASLVLSAFNLFNPGSDGNSGRNYLQQLYTPEKENACVFHNEEKMGGNTYKYVCIFDNYNGFPIGGMDCDVDLTYQIAKGNYKTII